MTKGERDFENFLLTPNILKIDGRYGIPKMNGLRVVSELQLTEYHTSKRFTKEARKDVYVHFFLPDYLFVRLWTQPNKNLQYLSQFKGVFSPDFSQYTDMPEALKIYNHYRKMWLSAWYQYNGIKVIPVACWSDEKSFEYCFDGMPKHSTIAVSSLGVLNNKRAKAAFLLGYEEMKDRLAPYNILWYGRKPEWIEDDVVVYGSSCDERFEQLRLKKEVEKDLVSTIAEYSTPRLKG